MSIVTLLRCDSYLDFVAKSPLHMTFLFQDDIITKSEEDIGQHGNNLVIKGQGKASNYSQLTVFINYNYCILQLGKNDQEERNLCRQLSNFNQIVLMSIMYHFHIAQP